MQIYDNEFNLHHWGGSGGGIRGGSIEPPKLKQLTSKPCKNIKETQSFLKFLKVHSQVTTIFKKWDFKTSWLCLRLAEITFQEDLKFQNFPAEDAIEPPLLKSWIQASIKKFIMIYGLFLRIFLKFFSIECGASREIFWWFVPPKWTKELCSRLPGGNYSMVPSACRISLLFHWLERLLDKGETRSSVLHWKLRAEMDWIYNSGTWNCRASCGGLDLFNCMFALILSPPSQSRTSLRQSGA